MADTLSSPVMKTRSWAWPAAAVAITLLLIVGLVGGYLAVSAFNTVRSAPERIAGVVARAAADAARPRIDINQLVVNSIEDLHKENKLVVYTAKVNADVTQSEALSRFGVYWGTNVARVVARDARVQYVIDLSQLQSSDFAYDEPAKVLSVFLPRPKIDQGMVAIDPAKIETVDLRGGWARFDKDETLESAVAELRPNVISQASAPYIRELAQAGGIETATRLLQPLADTLARDGVTVRVSYRE